MSDSLTALDEVRYEPSETFVTESNVYAFMQKHGIADFEELHRRTVTDIDGEPASGLDWFWDEIVDYLDLEFYEAYEQVRDDTDGPQFTDWYVGGELNIAHNVVDRHAAPDAANRNTIATLWEGEDGTVREITYHELHQQANRVANALEARGIGPGDAVGLYMPMVPEIVPLLYGCFKVGAIAVPIFSGFGVDATATRIEDAECSVLFTGDGFYRRGSEIDLKSAADEAIEAAGHVEHTIVYNRLGSTESGLSWDSDRDEWWTDAVGSQSDEYETQSLPADHESMLLYSSGTTGKPKGIVHTHAGGLVQPAKEIFFSFDHKPADRFFWVSDIGWMMGPWTLIGNHAHGGTVFMYEGAPDYPEPDRFWEMIDTHNLSVFGISPTAIRSLQKHGDEWLEGHDLSTLRLLGSTGEPWDPDSWEWFLENVGDGTTPIMNISGGTEIFGCFLQPTPLHSLKPGTLGGPALGMDIDVVDAQGESVAEDNEKGYLVCQSSAPSMTKSLWSGDERYLAEYWSRFGDMWDHGDWAQKDEDGFWFLHGRSDDVLNVAGRKVGPAEVESALIEHDAVNAAVAIGADDETKGTAVVTYVILNEGVEESADLREALRAQVGRALGKPFRPREVRFVDEFPETQSGKIVRRIIQNVYEGAELGDLSSIENPDAIDEIDNAR
ncbi:acyl-coenzyme A synthetases [Haloarcula marismortui ATCC 43049]|uniref:acetate--CoA ligase n=1 Tax=Haloarcula marismortui (strain ATCC 43049 / DSM 3752 / JCM 8966 / VKM B-1809) TaxID=272569 RepID=Q5UWF6_HALMA|nr:AMP-binding protein [Haloarcula marismortui]AAV48397.1 acyl-coenzyme A synthetases [Haloarcula marismortui ATCC 43049]QCP89917.1 acetyl-CoA synthetase [Haloarcula marismortui ATCC 43049]